MKQNIEVKKELIEKIKVKALKESNVDIENLPLPIRIDDGRKLVHVYVEGYDDVAFWRGIFDDFKNPKLRFEISVPPQKGMPKGKKVLLSMADKSSEELLLCMDSDFDYLLSEENEQSRLIVESPFLFHTYAYATENYSCYAPSLHNVCVKVTKNDTRIFSFEKFMAEYSLIIYPLFLWYVCSASRHTEAIFPLHDFRNAVRLGYLDIYNNGERTLAWLQKNVSACSSRLQKEHPDIAYFIPKVADYLKRKGVQPEETYLYMHGHTLMDNVVLVILEEVCEKLRQHSLAKIIDSSLSGPAMENELNNYRNCLRSIKDVLLDNENYKSCPLYKRLEEDIRNYLKIALEK